MDGTNRCVWFRWIPESVIGVGPRPFPFACIGADTFESDWSCCQRRGMDAKLT